MPRSPSQHALARRALLEDVDSARRTWVQQGVAVIGISVLGLGVAGSVALTGDAHGTSSHRNPQLVASPAWSLMSTQLRPGGAAPSPFVRQDAWISRSGDRPALVAAALSRRADQRSDNLAAAREQTREAARAEAAHARAASLAEASHAAKKQATLIKRARARAAAQRVAVRRAAADRVAAKQAALDRAADRRTAARRAANQRAALHRQPVKRSSAQSRRVAPSSGNRSGHASLPITSGYHIAARFGDTGVWSRYHTGLDFAAPIGTTVRAVAPGVVSHAGSGRAGWAGHYVTIQHDDGRTTLYAHLSRVSVRQGERVSGGDRVGAVGMTGRTFGPHLHFELYPAGVGPGSVYRAVNPAPWLRAHGLRF